MPKLSQNQNQKNNSGFTLIEIIVSLAIFTIVAVVAVGAFIKILDANKKAQALQSATNNLNFALESMTREMRVGSLYTIGSTFGSISKLDASDVNNSLESESLSSSDNGSGMFYIAFESSKRADDVGGEECNLVIIYKFVKENSGTIQISKAEQDSCNDNISVNNGNNDNRFTSVLSPNVTLDLVQVNFTGCAGSQSCGEYVQPYISIRLKGYSGVSEASKSYFDIQTSVAQRQSIRDFDN